MASRRNAPDPEDDGRTIADMNVEGMPWYHRSPSEPSEGSQLPREPMTREEQRIYTWAAVKAGLLIVLVFALVFFLFLCFTDFVWFGNSL